MAKNSVVAQFENEKSCVRVSLDEVIALLD